MLGGGRGTQTPGSAQPPRRGNAGGWGQVGWAPTRLGPHSAVGVVEAGGDGAPTVRGAPGSSERDSVSLAKRRGCKDGKR